MTAAELLALIRSAESVAEIAIRAWREVRNTPPGTPAEVIQELDDRSRDYDERIENARRRAEPTPAGTPLGQEPDLHG